MKNRMRSKSNQKGKGALLNGQAAGSPPLTAELLDQLGGTNENTSNAILLPAQSKRGREETDHAGSPAAKKSKSQLRKLKRIQEEKEKREKRAEVYAALEKHRLDGTAQQLLLSSGTMGQTGTLKERLHRALLFQKAGLPIPADAPLLRQRGHAADEDSAQEQVAEPLPVIVDKTAKLTDASRAVHTEPKDASPKQAQKGSAKLPDTSKAMNRKLNSATEVAAHGKEQKGVAQVSVDSKLDIRRERETEQEGGVESWGEELIGGWGVEPQEDQAKAKVRQKTKTEMRKVEVPKVKKKKKRTGSADLAPKIVEPNVTTEPAENGKKTSKKRKTKDPNLVDGSLVRDIPSAVDQSTDQHKAAEVVNRRAPRKGAFVVHVERSEEGQEARENLPIIGMEQEIMEAVNDADVIVVYGETGCGKTTQVPQFLYEAGYGSPACLGHPGAIGVTQPRRVAALATAKRVAWELGTTLGGAVGFQVRHDRRVGDKSALKFMTDGILLREVQSDFLLRKYSAIIIDEAHERSLNTDILIGLLSRIVPLRRQLSSDKSHQPPVTPLKLIIMSATLRIEDFTSNQRLCPSPPPVIRVPARQFPVTVHFSRRTEVLDYLTAAYKKVCAIHKQLPSGGILVFLTGQREVEELCKRLRKAFDKKGKGSLEVPNKGALEVPKPGGEDQAVEEAIEVPEAATAFDKDTGELEEPLSDSECLDVLDPEEDDFDSESDQELLTTVTPDDVSNVSKLPPLVNLVQDEEKKGGPGPLYVLPLYAMLPASAQLRVFQPPPESHRLVVVATNVAETSLTIPGIRFVVDTGRAKERTYDRASGLSKFQVCWVSKASADQRAGRAGRVGPGHCYRLYSSAHFQNSFPQYAQPEIENVPIEGIVLQMKAMGIEKVVNFPFPTPPDRSALASAETSLVALSALDPRSRSITPLGQAMSAYPISPRHARTLLSAIGTGTLKVPRSLKLPDLTVLAHALAVVAAMSMESPFTRTDGESKGSAQKGAARRAHGRFKVPGSDALSAAKALRAFEKAAEEAREPIRESTGSPAAEAFCKANFLHFRTLREMALLRRQLARLVAGQVAGAATSAEVATSAAEVEAQLRSSWATPLSRSQEAKVRRAVCAGWADRVARRLRPGQVVSEAGSSEGHSRKAVRYQACSAEGTVHLHPHSSVAGEAPEYVCYAELVQGEKRTYMEGVTAVDSKWLPVEAAPLCTFSKPLADPAPWYDSAKDTVMCWVEPTFGSHRWSLALHPVEMKMGKTRTAVFAAALLSGKVLKCMEALQGCLAGPPSETLRPEAGVQKRVAELLLRLERGQAGSLAGLRENWKKDRSYLLEEFRSWLKSGKRGVLDSLWPKIMAEAFSAGKS